MGAHVSPILNYSIFMVQYQDFLSLNIESSFKLICQEPLETFKIRLCLRFFVAVLIVVC